MGYKLYKDKSDDKKINNKKMYSKEELNNMTTYQLKEICLNEKLIKSSIKDLDREDLINLVNRYRGIRDNLLIKTRKDSGYLKVEEFIKNADKVENINNDLRMPTKIDIYDNLSIEIFDDYKVHSSKALEEVNVLLTDVDFNLITIFNLIEIEGNWYLVKAKDIDVKETSSNEYNLIYLEKHDSDLIYNIYYDNRKHLPKYLSYSKFSIIDFNIKDLQDTDTYLAIDFGTTSTTAGIYVNSKDLHYNKNIKAENIKVARVLGGDNYQSITPLIPSVVAVKASSNKEISYCFGYEAMKLSKSNYLEDRACIFYDIKRWISDYEREEVIFGIGGERVLIKRKEIVKAYLEYVINICQQQFKLKFSNLHISCPMKQKNRFTNFFKEALPEYNIEENGLDEGTAVLFSTIYNMIESHNFDDGEEYKALIIDCGGGTTDVSSCKFTIENNRISYSIDIESYYENGDTDFGGNNLTFRLVEFLKIAFYEEITKCKTNVRNKVLLGLDSDTFREIDKKGKDEFYSDFEGEYEKIEELIPTKFAKYEEFSNDSYLKSKGNFYFLFQLADKIKKIFFNNKVLEIELNPIIEDLHYFDKIFYDKWQLNILKDGSLIPLKEAPILKINMQEISTLLRGDIYSIIKKFIEEMYENEELLDYSIIKLTGQSCNIDIFREALKEFIPGRLIQSRKSRKDNFYQLKLTCLNGAINYLQNKRFGFFDITMKSNIQSLPYIITSFTHDGEEKILINRENDKGNISRFKEEITLNLFLKDNEEEVRHKYIYESKLSDFYEITFEEIESKFKDKILQDETDNIIEKEIKFFLWSENEKWGFVVVPVLREDEKLYVGKEKFFNYENDLWEKNLFDGLR